MLGRVEKSGKPWEGLFQFRTAAGPVLAHQLGVWVQHALSSTSVLELIANIYQASESQ